MRFFVFASSVLVASSLVACGSDSASPAPSDASAEAAPGDSGREGGGCPFGCSNDGGTSGDADADAADMCTQLKAVIAQLGTAARACNPNRSMECSGQTEGICCPISVSPGNNAAVSAFDNAVAAFKASCTMDCSMARCSMNVPSNSCTAPMGSMTGACD